MGFSRFVWPLRLPFFVLSTGAPVVVLHFLWSLMNIYVFTPTNINIIAVCCMSRAQFAGQRITKQTMIW